MAELKGLCMKCRNAENKPTMQVMTEVVVTKNEKGRFSAKGKCATCGGNMFKFMSAETAAEYM